MADTPKTIITGADLAKKFDQEWGAFRKWLAAHPLTGFWCAIVAGALAATFVAHL